MLQNELSRPEATLPTKTFILMDKAEFDKFAGEYRSLHASNIAISGEAPDYFADYKIKDLADEYMRFGVKASSAPAVLDFGAGIGTSVPFVPKYLPGSRLTYLDVSTKNIEVRQCRFPGEANLRGSTEPKFLSLTGASTSYLRPAYFITLTMTNMQHCWLNFAAS